jgi:hypothetical protein
MRRGADLRKGWMAAMSWGRSETAHLIQALMAGHMATGVGERLDSGVWGMVPRWCPCGATKVDSHGNFSAGLPGWREEKPWKNLTIPFLLQWASAKVIKGGKISLSVG